MNRKLALILIILFGFRCSEPPEFVRLPGKWSIIDNGVKVYGISSIDQAVINRSAPVPMTLVFSIPDQIQFNHVTLFRDGDFLTLDLVDDLQAPHYRLHLLKTMMVNETRFYIGDRLFKVARASFTYDESTAQLNIQPITLINGADSIDVSGSVIFSHELLKADSLALLQTPDPVEFQGINIDSLNLQDNQSCSVTFHTPVASLPKMGTWSYTSSQLSFVLQDELLSYSYSIADDLLSLEDEPEYFSPLLTRWTEIEYGVLLETLSKVYSVNSSHFERIMWETP